MSATDRPDILVVGAGPVGLAMAYELARHGRSCRLIDAAGVSAAEPTLPMIQALVTRRGPAGVVLRDATYCPAVVAHPSPARNVLRHNGRNQYRGLTAWTGTI